MRGGQTTASLKLDDQPGRLLPGDSLDSQRLPWEETAHRSMAEELFLKVRWEDQTDAAAGAEGHF